MKGLNSKEYFHVCEDGRMHTWMFQDESDFIAGVNRMGICCLRTSVKVIAYVLMDNHVHFVLCGTMPECKRFRCILTSRPWMASSKVPSHAR